MPMTVDPVPSTSAKRPVPGASSPLTKRAKVANFHSDDEDLASPVSGPSFAPNGNVKLSKVKTKALLKQEAERLLTGRKELPIWAAREPVLNALAKHDTIVILGETGSGKTTQLPQFILRSKIPNSEPRIAVTQPRRVAAMSLATRVAAEVGTTLGNLVGYTVRFADLTTSKTRLKYMTDGTLLAEMLGDKNLDKYDVVILDEAHERSLRTDMLMGFLKVIQVRRKEVLKLWRLANPGKLNTERDEGGERPPTELKLIIMSATLDAKRFSEFFNNAPVLYVKGRQFEVKIAYATEAQTDYCDAALKTIFLIHTQQPPGDILVFLPGQEDIDNLQSSIKAYFPDLEKQPALSPIVICPLYAKLPPAEQAKAFLPAPPKTRKVILATNVAETSITIPGVRYVIDTGFCKEKQHHASVGIDSLVVQSISQSSAMQRTGRAGREGPGRCYRLYTEEDFLKLPPSPIPEIRRVSLTFALLHLLANGQENVWEFEYMDAPDQESVKVALASLIGLEAVGNKNGKLFITPLGLQMSRLPLDPLSARVLLSSFEAGCSKEIIDLVSLLGQRDSLLFSSVATREAADKARAKFSDRSGDHMMLLRILRAFEEVPKSEQKQWCRDNFVNAKSMGNVFESRRQLKERCNRLKLDSELSCGDDSETILNTCITGLFANTATLQPDGSYRQCMSRQVISIHPGSSLSGKKCPAILYDELVLTTKTYARGVSEISKNSLRSQAPAAFATIV